MITIRNYRKVTSLEEAWELNQQRTNRILGGMLWMKMEKGAVQTAIDLSGLSLDTIEETEDAFRIGCMVSLRDLELHCGIDAYTNGAMKEALRHIVGVQFRNLATVGGSVFGRFGFSDVCTMFLAMDSYVELYKGGIISMKEFMEKDYDRDILVNVLVKKTPARFAYRFVRNAQTDFPVLTCAGACFLNEDEEKWQFALGARPGRAILLKDAERILKGDPDAGKAETFGRYAATHIPTDSNLRGSAEYRSHLVKVLTERTALELGGMTYADSY